jgi:hypothetical protein
MKFSNIMGQSYRLSPEVLPNPNNNQVLPSSNMITGKVIFFGGTIPDIQTLLLLVKEDLEDPEKYTKLMETEEFQISLIYDSLRKSRLIRKTEIDAQEIFYLNSGTITWCAIVLNNPNAPQEYILFTPDIGLWGAAKSPIIIDNKTGEAGDRNLFKHMSLEITDKTTLSM